MYRAIRAFYRFSQYPETRPYRWRAFRVQATRDVVRILWFTLTFPIWGTYTAFMLITLPIYLLHDWADRRGVHFGAPIEPVENWWRGAVEELNPIYLAAEKRARR